MRAQFFTTASLGPKRHFTPEGFLVCEEVPIARIGEQLYFAHEVQGVVPAPDGSIIVTRDAADVFADAAIRSYHGKSITNDHPAANITPDTFRNFTAGSVLNPRKGEGALEGWMVADFMVCDRAAIQAVLAGKKEVSCGYTADYEPIGIGRARQHNFIGNHVALVTKGRCGTTCAIGDSAPMTQTLAERLRASFHTKDAAAFETELATIQGSSAAAGGEPVHVHIHNSGTADKAPVGAPAPGAPLTLDAIAGIFKPTADAIDALAKRVDKLEGKPVDASPAVVQDGAPLETDEARQRRLAAEEAERNKPKTVTVLDAAAIPAALADLRSRAEILLPSIKLPTIDAAGTPQQVTDAICSTRRNVMTALQMAGGPNAEVMATVLASQPSLDRMACDAVGLAFQQTSDLVKQRNNSGAKTSGAPQHVGSAGVVADKLTEINNANRKAFGLPTL